MAASTMPLPPLFIDGAEYTADHVRRALSTLALDTPGIFAVDALQVRDNPGDTVTVSAGTVALPAPEGYRGVCLAEADTPVTLPLAPRHATQRRVDLVHAYVVPPPTPTEPGTWRIEVVTGTPSADPVPPTAARSLVLAHVHVGPESSSGGYYVSDERTSGAQAMLGPVLSTRTRPTTARPGTLWMDGFNSNTWVRGYDRWYPVGVPRFQSAYERDTAFDRPIESALAVTRNPWTLWCHTGAGTGWKAIGDTERAHHALSASTQVASGATQTLDYWQMATGHDGKIAAALGKNITLGRPGRWNIGVRLHSDSGAGGLSGGIVRWPGGSFFNGDNLIDEVPRASGFSGAGRLYQNLSWTGNVTEAQATVPLQVDVRWTAADGRFAADYVAWMTLEYLGR